MPSATAFDHLSRAVANLRANPELLLAYLVQQVGMLALGLLSVVVLFIPFGFGPGRLGAGIDALERMDAAELEQAVGALLVELPELLAPLAAGLLASTLVGGLALFLGCWFNAGIFATLVAGEERVEPGPPPGHRAFRAFSIPHFLAGARRYAWRFFWFVNLYLVYLLLAVLVWTLAVAAAVWCGERWGIAAALGVGCLGTLPLLPALVALSAWMWLGMADLARPDAGVRRSARRAAAVLRRRPGAVLLFLVMALGASLLVGAGTVPADVGMSLLVERARAAWCAFQALMYLVQFVASAVIGLTLAGAMVALVHDEARHARGAAA